MYHIFFIHSSFDGHRGSFHSLAIVDILAKILKQLSNMRKNIKSHKFAMNENTGNLSCHSEELFAYSRIEKYITWKFLKILDELNSRIWIIEKKEFEERLIKMIQSE